MHVSNVLIDEVTAGSPDTPAVITSVLHEFESRRWISADRQTGRKLGPLTVIDEGNPAFPLDRATHFGSRELFDDGTALSYEETWTIPAWTVYALLLPMEFVARRLEIIHKDSDAVEVGYSTRATHDDRLFYYAAFGGAEDQHLVSVRARIEHNPFESAEMIHRIGKVAGPELYPLTRSTAAAVIRTPDFWLKFLEWGGKATGLW
jgi:hypothetical protein